MVLWITQPKQIPGEVWWVWPYQNGNSGGWNAQLLQGCAQRRNKWQNHSPLPSITAKGNVSEVPQKGEAVVKQQRPQIQHSQWLICGLQNPLFCLRRQGCLYPWHTESTVTLKNKVFSLFPPVFLWCPLQTPPRQLSCTEHDWRRSRHLLKRQSCGSHRLCAFQSLDHSQPWETIPGTYSEEAVDLWTASWTKCSEAQPCGQWCKVRDLDFSEHPA